MLKPLIIILLIAVVLSLFSGLLFLFKDSNRRDSKRTLHVLGIRICLATALLVSIFYGFYTGQLSLGANAPWHQLAHPDSGQAGTASLRGNRLPAIRSPSSPSPSDNVDENEQTQPDDVDEVPVP